MRRGCKRINFNRVGVDDRGPKCQPCCLPSSAFLGPVLYPTSCSLTSCMFDRPFEVMLPLRACLLDNANSYCTTDRVLHLSNIGKGFERFRARSLTHARKTLRFARESPVPRIYTRSGVQVIRTIRATSSANRSESSTIIIIFNLHLQYQGRAGAATIWHQLYSSLA